MTEMVASVTLSLRDQLTGGLDDVLAVLRDIRAMMTELREATVGVERQLAVMADAFKPAQEAAAGVVREVAAVGAAAKVSAREVAVMTDAARGGGGGRGGGHVVATGGAGAAAHGGASVMDLFGDVITAAFGLEAIKKYADYQQYLGHIAITEGLSGNAATAEMRRLQAEINPLAVRTGTSSLDLADAYYSLIRQHISPAVIDQALPALAQASTAYNTPVRDMSNAVFAILDQLRTPVSDLKVALTELALAGKQAHFAFKDFSTYLPSFGALANFYGMSGKSAVADLAAQAEVVVKSAQDPAQAATNLTALYTYLASPMAGRMFGLSKRQWDMMAPGQRRLFDEYHIGRVDLTELLNNARLHHLDPVTALRDYFLKILAPVKSPTDRMAIVGALVHRQDAELAMLSLIEHAGEMDRIKAMLTGTQPGQINTDFSTAMGFPEVQVKQFGENMSQLARLIGGDLLPEFRLLNVALADIVKTADVMPKTTELGLGLAAGWLSWKTLGTAWRVGRSWLFGGARTAAATAEGASGEGGSLVAAALPIPGLGELVGGLLAIGGVSALMTDARDHVQALKENTAALEAASAQAKAAASDPIRRPLTVGGWGPMHGFDLHPRVTAPEQTLARP